MKNGAQKAFPADSVIARYPPQASSMRGQLLPGCAIADMYRRPIELPEIAKVFIREMHAFSAETSACIVGTSWMPDGSFASGRLNRLG